MSHASSYSPKHRTDRRAFQATRFLHRLFGAFLGQIEHPTYFLAAFVPYFGRLGAGFGFLFLVYIIVVLAAIAVPAYHDYSVRAKMTAAINGSQGARDGLGTYYFANQKVPESLESAGVTAELADGIHLSLGQEGMVLTVSTPQGDLIFTPSADARRQIIWSCTPGEGLKPTQVPPICRSGAPAPGSNQ